MSLLKPRNVNYTRFYGLVSNRSAFARNQHQFIINTTRWKSFQTITNCPEPTCTCEETPQNLDIDRKSSINGTIVQYSKHLIISTNQSDWSSKIEDEKDNHLPWGKFISNLKSFIVRGGEFHDPYKNLLLSLSSFKSSSPSTEIEFLLFPDFKKYTLQLENPSSSYDTARKFMKSIITSDNNPKFEGINYQESKIVSPTILICSHGSRDKRCGIIGPLLHAEFQRYLSSKKKDDDNNNFQNFNLGNISHIGGHKWAGNVIIYFPLIDRTDDNDDGKKIKNNDLSGKSIWYGRVEPKHVQGIIKETIIKGNIIEELFRGGIDSKGNMLKL